MEIKNIVFVASMSNFALKIIFISIQVSFEIFNFKIKRLNREITQYITTLFVKS